MINEIEIVGNNKSGVVKIGSLQDWGKASLIQYTYEGPVEWIKLPFKKVVKIGIDSRVWVKRDGKLVDISLENDWEDFWSNVEVNENQ